MQPCSSPVAPFLRIPIKLPEVRHDTPSKHPHSRHTISSRAAATPALSWLPARLSSPPELQWHAVANAALWARWAEQMKTLLQRPLPIASPSLRLTAVVALLALVAGCAPVRVTDYRELSPAFQVEQFFQGPLAAHGVVKNRSGKVIRTFSASIDARWENGVGVLDEDFVFNDGEQQKRVWTLRRQADGSYLGTAGDVVGEGVLRQSGNAVFLDYVLQVPYRGDTIDLRVDDRMYLLTPDILINESSLSKFGVNVGELLLVIHRLPTQD